MSVGTSYSAAHFGIQGAVVKVEAVAYDRLPKISISGLPGNIVKESRDRVQGYLKSLGFSSPDRKVLVHLSPAGLRKEGSQFDVAIALSLLSAEAKVRSTKLSHMGFIGELALNGKILPVRGALSLMSSLVAHSDVELVVVPRGNEREATLLNSPKLRVVQHMGELIDALSGRGVLSEPNPRPEKVKELEPARVLDQVLGQPAAKRVLEICLAGGHHVLFVGPPGVGKTMLAQAAASLLPPLSAKEEIEIAQCQSFHSRLNVNSIHRPFRSPHHSISNAALLGGGTGTLVPGEVTLSHRGVLFLDEFPEFQRNAIEGLREPLQEGMIRLHRVGWQHTLPAKFTLIAAMNPCPCGYSMTHADRCRCHSAQVSRYRKRISGPMFDRFELGLLLQSRGTESTSPMQTHDKIKERIAKAHQRQLMRKEEKKSETESVSMEVHPEAMAWLKKLKDKEDLSYRSFTKHLRVAQTIADLEGDLKVKLDHLYEAWNFRCQDLNTM